LLELARILVSVGIRGFQARLSGMVFAEFAFRALEHPRFELRTAQTPATAERGELRRSDMFPTI
jgi:hypothetical protein